ncbi:MAG TPA: TadE family protein [Ktedonobacterales bacterium]|nr:TadE family protein [Ktedonobacterales bacterium]
MMEKSLLASTKRRRRHQSGQTLVEFALVAPLLLMVIFGTIEFCFLYQSVNTVSFAAREGARVGAVLGPTDSAADSKIIQAIFNATTNGSGLLFSQITMIEIFKSNESGSVPAQLTSCTSASNEDVYDGQGNLCGTQNWPPNVRNATFNNADYLGVRITFVYNWVTSFVSAARGSFQMTSVSIQLIEPQTF